MNAFLELAARQLSAPTKARQRAAEKRAVTAATRQEKELLQRDTMFRTWRLWRQERLEALLNGNGPHGGAARELVAFLQKTTPDDGAALLGRVRAYAWGQADAETRFEVLSLINTAIVRAREVAGLEPFDDGVPDEPLTAFLIIRELFR